MEKEYELSLSLMKVLNDYLPIALTKIGGDEVKIIRAKIFGKVRKFSEEVLEELR